MWVVSNWRSALGSDACWRTPLYISTHRLPSFILHRPGLWTSTWGPQLHRLPMLTRNCLLLFLWILVNAGSVSSSRPPSSPLGRGRAGREHARSSAGSARNGAAGFQRVKRGWVWNQFFVLEEYMGSDPQYVGKVRSLFPIIFLSFLCSYLWDGRGHKSHSKKRRRNWIGGK